MIEQGGTTLWEFQGMTPFSCCMATRNHAMWGSSGYYYYSSLAGLARADGSHSWATLALAPPRPATNGGGGGGDNGVSSVLDVLHSAAASIDTPMGLVASSWASGAGSASAQARNLCGGVCGFSFQGGNASIACGGGGAFTRVRFASWGMADGDCGGGFAVNETCDANATAVIATACLGRSSCAIPASPAIFGNPCVGFKWLAVVLEGPCTNAVPLYALAAILPPNAKGSIALPTVIAPADVNITESNRTVWAAGAYIGGAPGITAAAIDAAGTAVVFEAGSGAYDFRVLRGV